MNDDTKLTFKVDASTFADGRIKIETIWGHGYKLVIKDCRSN